MSRSDLLVQLVEAGAQNDHVMLERAVAAMVAEARARQHNTLADRLNGVLQGREKAKTPRAVGGVFLTEKVRDLIVERPARRQLSDLHLPEGVVQDVVDLCVEQHRADLLRANSLEPRNRLMLVGPPGNGKTSLAEAMAFELARPLFVARYESIIGSYLGETAARLKRIFDFVRTTPCVLLLDEFDAIGKERGDVHETGEIKRVVSSLLMQIDELPSYVVVVCASNHPELLDRAVWRRFPLRLTLPPPGRAQIKVMLSALQDGPDAIKLPVDTLLKTLKGASFAEVEEFVLDIRRRVVLAQKRSSVSEIISRQLNSWRRRYRLAGPGDALRGDEPDHSADEGNGGEPTHYRQEVGP